MEHVGYRPLCLARCIWGIWVVILLGWAKIFWMGSKMRTQWHVPSMFHNLSGFHNVTQWACNFWTMGKVRKTQKDLTPMCLCKGEVKKRQKRPHGGGSVRHLRQGNSQVGMINTWMYSKNGSCWHQTLDRGDNVVDSTWTCHVFSCHSGC
jgi:hypothetical protein